jgi:hypothetical protein
MTTMFAPENKNSQWGIKHTTIQLIILLLKSLFKSTHYCQNWPRWLGASGMFILQ